MDDTIVVYKSKNTRKTLPNLLQTILSSINDKLIVEISYTNIDEYKTQRALEIVGITYTHPNWYLAAWCHLRKKYQVFKLDRIESIKITAKKHTNVHPPLELLFGCDPKSLIKVILHTSKEVSKYYTNRCDYMGLTKERELENGQIEQTYMAYSLENLARWVLANADTTTVVSPIEVKNIMKQIIKKLDL
jgi:predicted DNA-binding transcriptional regulator YafY